MSSSAELASGDDDAVDLSEPGAELLLDEDPEPLRVEYGTPRVSQGIAMGAALFGMVLTTTGATLGLLFGFSGLVVVAGALFVAESRGWLTVGTALLLLGAIITAGFGVVPPELMLMGVAAILLAWDVGQHGMVLGNQIGVGVPIVRNQVVHTALTATVLGLISMLSYGVYIIAGTGLHVSGVALLIIGIVIVTWVLRS